LNESRKENTMEWSDQGLVLGIRRHGETSVIAELMTCEHGRSLGLVRGGRSRKMRPLLQPGNLINVVWRARLDEHLGHFQVEPERLRAAAIMANRISLYCVQIIAAHLRLLPERQSHPHLYEAANIIMDHAHDPQIAAHLIIRFEMALLEDLGFGLNLSQCVVSGSKQDLTWVSPKSGCAVSRKEGEPWAEKLLPLPQFLTAGKSSDNLQKHTPTATLDDLKAGFDLTGYFLQRHVFIPRAFRVPDERDKLVKELVKQGV
jgi:DNA repair protein RecO (recombination protein O)